MISDFETHYGTDPRTSSWEKVTRRIVDPITFVCRVNITYVPRIEDCSYETTNIAIGQPRFGEERLPVTNKRHDDLYSPSTSTPTSTNGKKSIVLNSKNKSNIQNDDNAWKPHNFPVNDKKTSKSPAPAPVKHVKNHVKPTKSGVSGAGDKGASLGAFFFKDAVKKAVELDEQSMSSRSMNSRSVSERSNAERSKAEEKIKSRRVHVASHHHEGSSNAAEMVGMMSIDEQSVSEFREKKSKGGMLGQFLNEKSLPNQTPIEDDHHSVMSASTIGTKSVSLLSTADRSKNEKVLQSSREAKAKDQQDTSPSNLEPNIMKMKLEKTEKLLTSILKKSGNRTLKSAKVDFKDGHDICEVPTLDDKEWYRDWDDIWYNEEELGDMRYAAFLEEAGLDVDQYMNM